MIIPPKKDHIGRFIINRYLLTLSRVVSKELEILRWLTYNWLMIGQTSSKTGRPSLYSSELGEEIAFRLAEGQSLRKICNNTDMPSWRTVLRWVSSKKHEFCQQYARARLVQADTYADEIIDIADAATTSELATIAKVRIDARKWVASKLKPQQYGERGSPLVEDKNNEPVLLYPSMTKEMALKIIAEQRLTEAKMGEEMKLVKP